MYVRSDGNGGVIISKTLIALITLFVLILVTCASVVAYSTGVANTAEEAMNLASEVEQRQNSQYDTIEKNRENIAVIKAQYDDIIRRLKNIEGKIDSR